MNLVFRNALIVLGVAIVLTAAGLGVLLSQEAAPAEATKVQARQVLIAARPIEAGQRLIKTDIAWQDVAPDKVPTGALMRDGRTELELVGAIVQRNLASGELLVDQALVKTPTVRTLAGSLNPGWRAITIAADASQTAAGMILPNDRVDLLLAAPKDDGMNTPKIALPFVKTAGPALSGEGTIISNVRVIAINGLMAPSDPASSIVDESAKGGGTITLEVPVEQVALIFSAVSNGQLVVSLRSRLDNISSPSKIEPARPASAGKKARPAAKAGRPGSAGRTAAIGADGSLAPQIIVIRGGGGSGGQ